METEQKEMQFLGIFGLFRESYNILLARRRIFALIAVSLILPLAFVFLIHHFFSRIIRIEVTLDVTRSSIPSYNKTSDLLSKEWASFLLFKVLDLDLLFKVLDLILSLLSTAAVVYAIACIYTGRELTFPEVMSVVRRIWHRLWVTFLCIFAVALSYNFTAALIFVTLSISVGDSAFGPFVTFLLGVAYIAGFVYITLMWQMASVVTVLEEEYGFRAMAKSRELLRGKTWGAAAAVFVLLNAGSYGMQVLLKNVVKVPGEWIGENLVMRVTSLQMVSMPMLLGLAVQTVIYFMCTVGPPRGFPGRVRPLEGPSDLSFSLIIWLVRKRIDNVIKWMEICKYRV